VSQRPGKRGRWVRGGLASALLLFGNAFAESPAPIQGTPGEIFAAVCAGCHGDRGQGKPEVLAPSIAGMPAWYTELQLRKFREGIRGKPHRDLSGQQMRAIAGALVPELAKPMAAHIAALPPIPTLPLEGAPGDAVRGGAMFQEVCAKCHRYNGQGEQVFRSAPLTSLPGWYLAESLRKFREGLRGYEHGDLDGPKMREIASLLGDAEIRDLVAHVATLAERYPPGQDVRAARERSVTPIPLPQ